MNLQIYDGIMSEDAAQWRIPAILNSKNIVYALVSPFIYFSKALLVT